MHSRSLQAKLTYLGAVVSTTTFENGDSSGPLLRAAVQQHQAGRLPEALALYNQVIVGDPRNGAAYCNKAAILAGQGKYVEGAISALETSGRFHLGPRRRDADQDALEWVEVMGPTARPPRPPTTGLAPASPAAAVASTSAGR